ncbi:phosphotransferase [Umezawaea sp. Da 62-37]|uniref:phosphotransferase enzyme family protein n=1 Tax=Umezawaea sp. Da 62-37 TaxID=3075927 RepID=UPI0028F6F052|nr:phosphotransferase [Umezawaea sp. Da 62-37]WNV84079.1 phosphotransferase [Umezawaea sp. Da 62-37]
MPDYEVDAFQDVFEHFGVHPTATRSCHPWAPVFRVESNGLPAVVKRTSTRTGGAIAAWCRGLAAAGIPVVVPLAGPSFVHGGAWVVYPWIEGRVYDGSAGDLVAAGDLLGRMHARRARGVGMAVFPWPDYSLVDPTDDLPELHRLFASHVPEVAARLAARLDPLARDFVARTLPAVRDGALPMVVGCMDFKAVNLVYAPAGPVLVDPDKALRVPRVLDLAVAVLLFHDEVGDGVFGVEEWRVFRDAYLGRVELTEGERRVWPDALDYVLWEEGTWAMEVSTGWGDVRQRAFLVSLAGVSRGGFSLE